MKNWIVDIKGDANESSWEISVILETNTHGFRSYGWFDNEKILIGSSSGPCKNKAIPFVFNRLLALEEETARKLNAGEIVVEQGWDYVCVQ